MLDRVGSMRALTELFVAFRIDAEDAEDEESRRGRDDETGDW